jgi:phage shock protein A
MTTQPPDRPPPTSADSTEAIKQEDSLRKLFAIPADEPLTFEQIQQLFVGVINAVRCSQPDLWHQLASEFVSDAAPPKAAARDPQSELEQAYQDTQNSLVEMRLATATAIATEKQLEQQEQKNRDQAQTWQHRADMATGQGNEGLAEQARQRKQQYVQAAADIKDQILIHHAATNQLREKLTETEGMVQRLYTKKQVLIARHKSATAALRANKAYSNFRVEKTLANLEELEKKVAALEREILENPIELPEELDSDKLLVQVTRALERAMKVLQRLEQEAQSRSPEKNQSDPNSPGSENNKSPDTQD